MAGSAAARVQSLEEIYGLVRTAVVSRRSISVTYEGGRRWLCPHVLGHNTLGQHRVFCYQYGGDSKSGLQPKRGVGSWRCIALDKLSHVELLDDPWRTEPHARQRCVEHVEFDAEHQPGGEPQNGQ